MPRAALDRPPRAATLELIATCALIVTLAMAGCTSAARHAENVAAREGLTATTVTGQPFLHRVFRNDAPSAGPLHIYIDGDGTPHPTPDTIAADPTPRHPLMLELLALDPHRGVYVGRPCYFALNDPACDARYWTLRRFSGEVADSLITVIRAEERRAQIEHVQLFAHSGGAVLAWTLASRLPEVTAVVTVAGNLDVPAWTQLHGYTPLEDAPNPADLPIRREGFVALHYAGGKDANVPPSLIREAAARAGGEVIEIADFGHTCCWSRIWPEVLARLSAKDVAATP
ncbi:MAG TPA: hypothetical protein VKB41_05545 [Steroidobacteraceae bacterium]|jgi:pimeloyl-ACP methyl ester carboxylesterase|nr:hypothetical protein [Steroidobacteraceae bacterium]